MQFGGGNVTRTLTLVVEGKYKPGGFRNAAADIGLGIGGATAAVAAFSVKTAAGFEDAMTHVRAFAGASQQQISAWSKQIMSMAPTLGLSATNMAQGLYNLASAGVKGKDAIIALHVAAKAAAGSQTDLSTATDVLTSVINTYGLHGKAIAKAQDDLTQTALIGKAEFKDLAASYGMVLPVAKQLGVGTKSLGAMFAELTNKGNSAAESSVMVKNTMQQLLAPTDKQFKTMNTLGLSMKDFKVHGGNIIPVFQRIKAALDEQHKKAPMTAKDYAQMQFQLRGVHLSYAAAEAGSKKFNQQTGNQAVLVRSLFGGNMVAMRTFFSLMGDGGKALEGYNKRMQHDNNITQTSLQKASKSTAFQWRQMKATGEVLAITIGNAILPTVNKLLKQLLPVVRSFAQWTQDNPKLVRTILMVGAGIGGIGVVLKGVTVAQKAWNAATTAWSAITKIATAAQWLWNAAMDANPIGLVIVGLAALAVGVVLLYNKWKPFREFVNAAWADLKKFASWVGSVMIPVFNNLKTTIMGIVSWVQSNWPKFLSTMQIVLTGAHNAVASFANFFTHTIPNAVGSVISWVHDHWRVIVPILLGPIGLAIVGWSKFGPRIMGFLSNLIGSVRTWAGKMVGAMGSAVTGGARRLTSAVTGIFTGAFTHAIDAVKKLPGMSWLIDTIGKVKGILSIGGGGGAALNLGGAKYPGGTFGGPLFGMPFANVLPGPPQSSGLPGGYHADIGVPAGTLVRLPPGKWSLARSFGTRGVGAGLEEYWTGPGGAVFDIMHMQSVRPIPLGKTLPGGTPIAVSGGVFGRDATSTSAAHLHVGFNRQALNYELFLTGGAGFFPAALNAAYQGPVPGLTPLGYPTARQGGGQTVVILASGGAPAPDAKFDPATGTFVSSDGTKTTSASGASAHSKAKAKAKAPASHMILHNGVWVQEVGVPDPTGKIHWYAPWSTVLTGPKAPKTRYVMDPYTHKYVPESYTTDKAGTRHYHSQFAGKEPRYIQNPITGQWVLEAHTVSPDGKWHFFNQFTAENPRSRRLSAIIGHETLKERGIRMVWQGINPRTLPQWGHGGYNVHQYVKDMFKLDELEREVKDQTARKLYVQGVLSWKQYQMIKQKDARQLTKENRQILESVGLAPHQVFASGQASAIHRINAGSAECREQAKTNQHLQTISRHAGNTAKSTATMAHQQAQALHSHRRRSGSPHRGDPRLPGGETRTIGFAPKPGH